MNASIKDSYWKKVGVYMNGSGDGSELSAGFIHEETLKKLLEVCRGGTSNSKRKIIVLSVKLWEVHRDYVVFFTGKGSFPYNLSLFIYYQERSTETENSAEQDFSKDWRD